MLLRIAQGQQRPAQVQADAKMLVDSGGVRDLGACFVACRAFCVLRFCVLRVEPKLRNCCLRFEIPHLRFGRAAKVRDPAVLEWASIPAGHNSAREWTRWTKGLYGCKLEPYMMRVNLWSAQAGRAVEATVPLLLPHEIYSELHRQSEALFLRSVLGLTPAGAVLEFWEQALMKPWGHGHPAFEDPSLLDRMHPLWLYYDGVESYTEQESHVFAVGSALQRGDNSVRLHLLCTVLEARVCTKELKRGLVNEFVRCCAWSLRCARLGIMPSRGPYGEEFSPGSWRQQRAGELIAGEHRLCFAGVQGDRKAMVMLHDFSRYWQTLQICERCLATRPSCSRAGDPGLSYGYVGRRATWPKTAVSHDEYAQEARQSSSQRAGRPVPAWRFPAWRFPASTVCVAIPCVAIPCVPCDSRSEAIRVDSLRGDFLRFARDCLAHVPRGLPSEPLKDGTCSSILRTCFTTCTWDTGVMQWALPWSKSWRARGASTPGATSSYDGTRTCASGCAATVCGHPGTGCSCGP